MPVPMEERIKIKKFFMVCIDGSPIGGMYDMGPQGKHGVKFPYEATRLHRELDDAKDAKRKMLLYVEDVKLNPPAKRQGSAKRW